MLSSQYNNDAATSTTAVTKGGLISESFSLWVKSPKIGANSLSWASSLYVDSALKSDLAPIFGDLSLSDKLSVIKPPLESSLWLWFDPQKR